MKSKIISVIVVLFSALTVLGSENRLDSAASAYASGNYSGAIALYEEVAKERGVSSALLADLGNAYVKAGDYGKGRLCYERSLLLSPGDRLVKNNLNYIINKIEDNNKAEARGKKVSVSPDSPSFFTSVKRWIAFNHSSDTWAVWAAVTFILFCGCVALYVFVSDVLVRKIGFFGGISLLGISIITLVFSFMSAKARDNIDSGVITGFKVVLVSEPFSTAKSSALPLTRGTRLDILDIEEGKGAEDPSWYKVRLNSDYVGWIPSTEFEKI